MQILSPQVFIAEEDLDFSESDKCSFVNMSAQMALKNMFPYELKLGLKLLW